MEGHKKKEGMRGESKHHKWACDLHEGCSSIFVMEGSLGNRLEYSKLLVRISSIIRVKKKIIRSEFSEVLHSVLV